MTRSRVTLSRKGDGADELWKARCAGSAESSSVSPNPNRAPHGPWLTFALAAAMLFAVSLLLKDTSFGGEEQRELLRPQIVGTWQLMSLYQEDGGGYEIDQFGGPARGVFVADQEGNFSLQIPNNRERRLLASMPPAVVLARPDGLIEAEACFGTYSLDAASRRLTLRVTDCLFLGCDRLDRTADVKIDGDVMEITSAAEPSLTGAFYSYSKWQRRCCSR